jgi:hypothetical protein
MICPILRISRSTITLTFASTDVRLALKCLAVGDVLSVIDDLIREEPDPSKHPCAALVAWLLDKQLTPLDGGALYDGWKALCLTAIGRLVDEGLTAAEQFYGH